MTTKSRYTQGACHSSLLFLALCLVNASAWAQTTPPPGGIAPQPREERPYRGLFGSGVGNTAQSVTLDGKLGGGFVENPLAEQGGIAPVGDPSTRGGASGVGSATLAYSMNRVRFGAHGSLLSLVDYYPGLEEGSMLHRHVLTGNLYYLPSERTRIAFMPSFKNMPEFALSDLFDPEVEQGVPPIQDVRLSLERYVRYGAAMEVTHQLTKRSRINGDISYGHGMIAAREWVIVMASGNFSYNIGKGIAMSVGYQEGGQRDVNPGAPQEPVERQPRINAGIDMNRALSFSRRTKLSFSTGVAGSQDRALKQTVYTLVGGAHLEREFGQTWVAGISFNRNLRQIEPLGEPFLSDTLTFGVQGSFSRRLQFQSHFGQSIGTLRHTGSEIENQFGSVQLSFALNRQLAIGADYAHSRFGVKGGEFPIEGVAGRNTRSFNTYLQVWVPLFNRIKPS